MSFETSHTRWQAVTTRLRAADGKFVYAVKSTRIYCRPTCPARLARRANVDFYRKPADAEAKGYRACKRCKPEVDGPAEDGQGEIVQRACGVIEAWARPSTVADADGRNLMSPSENKPLGLKDLASEVGKTPRYLHKIFKDRMGVTPKQYAEQLRALSHPATSAVESATRGHRDEILDFADFDFDFNDGPFSDLSQLNLDYPGNLETSATGLQTVEGSPQTLPSMPTTPDDLLVYNMAVEAPKDALCEMADLPALSSIALDGLLSSAILHEPGPNTEAFDWQAGGDLSDWVWEAEWSNEVVEGYHRTATIV